MNLNASHFLSVKKESMDMQQNETTGMMATSQMRTLGHLGTHKMSSTNNFQEPKGGYMLKSKHSTSDNIG